MSYQTNSFPNHGDRPTARCLLSAWGGITGLRIFPFIVYCSRHNRADAKKEIQQSMALWLVKLGDCRL